ncbi:hypothetical protein XM38_041680 [Halomicronema hongdechloris C2206]|uniref:Glycosyltransferase 2-like domain-containing protein n=1 Tax=Halomicronema hongdechloris C2206 TaxID=1641165 RepID=A0A1Z3HSG1_9CYAN|nr:glycosyltransferase [Halomicronema hongdechloris]ASC73206.1 hypothetical protein XM38_041680 [Halomicronema hongdechloris C2206]
MATLGLILVTLSLLIWLGLLLGWGQFWRADQRLPELAELPELPDYPAVCAIIPARNEAELLPTTMRSLLQQVYPGPFKIILIDDHSSDNTTVVARRMAAELEATERLTILKGQPLPPGWSGKLWAMDQGVRQALQGSAAPTYLLFTDADIDHHRHSLQQLVRYAHRHELDLTSLMVRLRCQSFWEKALIPAFVFFFQKLYPFPWVNDPSRAMAAAAGGCILIRPRALERIGGLQRVCNALIDDCALAAAVKLTAAPGQGRIWLGLTTQIHSLRPYPSLQAIWQMVARTAYTQLHYSPLWLFVSLIGMTLIYLVAPLALLWGLFSSHGILMLLAAITWGVMALAYRPTLRLYRLSPIWSLALPAIALLYTLMTLDSARRHWQGQGGAWKGRVYSGS